MILSLVTGGIYIANASAFVLLHPGEQLSAYISASSIYSMFVWTNLWIVPSTWGFRHGDIAIVRQSQFLVMAFGCLTILATHPSAVGISFASLLFFDTLIFYNYPLMYNEDTKTTQKIDFVRACIAVIALITSLLFFSGSPAYFSAFITLSTVVMGVVLWGTGWHRAPAISLNAAQFIEIIRSVFGSFRQKSLLSFLIGRLVEITSLLILGRFGFFNALISLKVGLSIGYTLSSNAKRYSPAVLFAVLNGLYGLAFLVIHALNVWMPHLLPQTLTMVGKGDAIQVLPIVNLCFAAILIGIRNR